jgi:putative hydrolase of the HAD superfamily
MNARVEVLLFDLGNVLVEFSGVRDLARLLPAPLTPEELVERWTNCPHSHAFQLGQMSADDYAERFVKDWRIALQPHEFMKEYRTWSRRLLPGARELLDELRPRFRIAALSNSNEAHWDRNSSEIGVTDLFEIAISSHQVGLCKPDPAIYKIALDRLGVAPESVMFFDDLAENVEAARSVGIRAYQTVGVDQVRGRLTREGLI